MELSQRLYRIDTFLNGSLTSQIGYLVHLRVEVKFAKQLFYRLCETHFMITRKQEKKITGNSGKIDYSVISNKLKKVLRSEVQ